MWLSAIKLAVSAGSKIYAADQAFNYIGTGKPELPVQGQGKVLAEKKRNSKAY